jgi:hypothetical protein
MPELNPICYLLALLGAQHILHISKIRVNPYQMKTPCEEIVLLSLSLRVGKVSISLGGSKL